jgi:hypothetical protein
VLSTLAVASLAARGALIAFDPMLGLVDRKNRHSPILVMTDSALLVPGKGSVHFCPCWYHSEKAYGKCTQRQEAMMRDFHSVSLNSASADEHRYREALIDMLFAVQRDLLS